MAFLIKHWSVAFVGGLWPPHDTTNDASVTTTRQPPPVRSRKCKHRWRINMNAKLPLHVFRPEWYALLLLHVSCIRRFRGTCGKTYLDPRLSSNRIPNETLRRRQSLTAVETLKKPTNHHGSRYVKKSKMYESQLASHDELTAVCGINPRSSSYLAPYTMPNLTR